MVLIVRVAVAHSKELLGINKKLGMMSIFQTNHFAKIMSKLVDTLLTITILTSPIYLFSYFSYAVSSLIAFVKELKD